jgi:deoxyribodipyrimidine photo-lyase
MLYVYWFRKDLRLVDNKALSEFCKSINSNDKFLFLYIKNKNSFKYFGEKRISFLYESLFELKNNLNKLNLDLNIVGGNSIDVFKKLIKNYGSLNVFINAQVEPYCIERDIEIENLLVQHSGKLNTFIDTNLMEFDKIFNNSSQPYTVFTPYKNKFLKFLSEKDYEEKKVNLSLLNNKKQIIPDGFIRPDIEKEYDNLDKSSLIKGGRESGVKLLNNFIKNSINNYSNGRDFPALNATSLLSPHLHFGTISIRECFRALKKLKKSDGIEKWRDELIWREFYYYITFNFPHVINGAFKKGFDNVNWNYDKNLFKQWRDGKTGFPIVDAGMRQLKEEGWMHNRVRMLVAMFLTKDLLIDWKLGEKYFAENLIDMDFASNNGGWQWSASTGCDAQPYFRIFNPYLQSKKFDAEGLYIKRYVDELKNVPIKYIHNPSEMPLEMQKKCGMIIGKDYPAPVVNHSIASKFAIETFKKISKKFY